MTIRTTIYGTIIKVDNVSITLNRASGSITHVMIDPTTEITTQLRVGTKVVVNLLMSGDGSNRAASVAPSAS